MYGRCPWQVSPLSAGWLRFRFVTWAKPLRQTPFCGSWHRINFINHFTYVYPLIMSGFRNSLSQITKTYQTNWRPSALSAVHLYGSTCRICRLVWELLPSGSTPRLPPLRVDGATSSQSLWQSRTNLPSQYLAFLAKLSHCHKFHMARISQGRRTNYSQILKPGNATVVLVWEELCHCLEVRPSNLTIWDP